MDFRGLIVSTGCSTGCPTGDEGSARSKVSESLIFPRGLNKKIIRLGITTGKIVFYSMGRYHGL